MFLHLFENILLTCLTAAKILTGACNPLVVVCCCVTVRYLFSIIFQLSCLNWFTFVSSGL